MPKNAVQRLHKLENDIKTVISIYEVTNNGNVKNDDTETESEVTPLPSPVTKPSNGDTSKWGLTKKCTSAFEHFKNLTNFSPRLGSRVQFSCEKKNEQIKPSSAPSSSSTATACESDYLWQPTSDSNNAKWTDLSGSYTALMTPSKTLQAANEVLSKNNFHTDNAETLTDNSASDPVLQPRNTGSPGREDDYFSQAFSMKPRMLQVEENETKSNKEKNRVRNGQRIEFSNSTNVKMREGSQKKITERQNKTFGPTNYITALIEKEFSAKNAQTASAETSSETSQTRHTIPKKIPRLVKERLESFEIKNREQNFSECFERPKWSSLDRKDHESMSKSAEKINCRGQEERCTYVDRYDKIEHKKNTKNADSLDISLSAQKIQKKEEDEKLSAIELYKIIEKSNEKLEKMQMSKELALDIAAQLKEKHEEMRRSKENMIEKLQKLEKDNERLSIEIKDAREKKRKLQLKIEGFCSYSKTKLLKQDLKSREILDENVWLKARLQELEKKYNENYIEKLVEMDKTQKERLMEIRNELKTRETKAEEEIKKLIYEKSKLLEKIEELHCCLHERQSKVEGLEGKISVLEAEVEKQKQNLKKKTERLEETHKELEAIRQKSKVLEEQVKTLRTNMESFDQMQKNLMTGIADRESQIKTSQTEIEKLQNENTGLRKEIEKEKDAVLIKNKIIEDQQETIKQLREKSEEVKTLIKRNQSLERLINREREEKLELQEALECLKIKKEELKKKIKSLEADLLLAPEEVVRDLQKTQLVLHELENQVHIKQKEWEHHLQLLIKEKEQACSVAEFATKKLMQTTSKFQKQSEAHKKLHKVLAENLAEKEMNIRDILNKGSCVQIKQIFSDTRPETKKSNRQLYTQQNISGNDNAVSPNAEWQPKKVYPVEEIRNKESSYFF